MPEHVDDFVPSWHDCTKSVAPELALLHSLPAKNSLFQLLTTAQSAIGPQPVLVASVSKNADNAVE